MKSERTAAIRTPQPWERRVPGSRPDRTRQIAALALLAAVTLLVYAPALPGGFFWDDHTWVEENATLRSLAGLWEIWFAPRAEPQYLPLMFTSFWLEYHLWGLTPFACHLTNVVLHLLNSLLLWRVLLRLRAPGALLAAALFALHPVHVESVAWITERKDVLSGAFYLLTVLAWCGWQRRRGWPRYGLMFLLFLCAMWSKGIASTLPFTLLLLAWWQVPRRWWRDIPAMVPLVAISVALGTVTHWREQLIGSVPKLSLPERAVLMGRTFWFYVGKLLWPVDLMRVYPRWQLDPSALWQYAFSAAAAALLIALWGARRRIGVAPFVAVAFFAVTLAPISGLVPFNYFRFSYVADHSEYLASAGLIALAAALLARSARTGRFLAAAMLAGLAVLSWRQARLYASSEVQWRDTVARNPGAAIAHGNLGTVLAQQKHYDEAVVHFREALRIDPAHVPAHTNWGAALQRQGKVDEALTHFEAALQINPQDPVANYNVGTIIGGRGQLDEAIAHLRTAVERDPSYVAAHDNLGAFLARQGRFDEAIAEFRETLRLDPSFRKAREHLEKATALRGK